MYYPKSQIQTDLYANPGEFIYLNSKQQYAGFYYKTSTGQFFSGKNPNVVPSLELVASQQQVDTLNIIKDLRFQGDLNTNYSIRKSIIQNELPSSISYYLNVPTLADYQLGSYLRYFCKRANQDIYIEISKDTYNLLVNKNPKILFTDYTPFQIIWTLIGENSESISKINLNIVSLTERRLSFRGLVRYFKNYSQFYKIS
jgi:hypothetical protein